MAVDALETYRGRTLLYVGEWRGSTGVVSALSNLTDECGQTAGAVFQEAVQRDWEPVERVALPRWPGFTDTLLVFRRKGSRDAATGFLAHTSVSAPRDMRTSSLSRRHIAVDG